MIQWIDLIQADDSKLIQINRDLGLGLDLDDLRACRDHFRNLGRNPSDLELQTIAQAWSEHCFHRTFKGDVISPKGRLLARNLLERFIARATKELNLSWCISVFKDNAGLIEFDSEYAIAAKVETHNHPCAIDPFGGAATGMGGVIRDILGVWGNPICCLDVLCFGFLDHPSEKIPEGIKHPRYLFNGVVSGIGHYGNNMGIPTLSGGIFFDDGYLGNVVVYCGCIGMLPKRKYIKNPAQGDLLVLMGNSTGRDGIHGATFASSELTKVPEQAWRSAVQIPDPIQQEKLRRAILEISRLELGTCITDLGAGGLSCAVCEIAHAHGLGAVVHLERVPLRQPDLAPWEIWISESQERMLLTIPRSNLDEVLQICDDEEVAAAQIGELTQGNKVQVFYSGYKLGDIDLDFLFNPPRKSRMALWIKPRFQEPKIPEPEDYGEELLELLRSPNISSRESVIRTYDHEVQGNTVIKPLHGIHAGPSDGAVIKPLEDSWRGIAISCGINPAYGKLDPYWMAASAIEEALRNNIALGGRRIAILDNFSWGSPEDPRNMGALLRALRACYRFSKYFGVPFISGKDSLYNDSVLGSIPPTLLITAIGIVPDIRRCMSLDLKHPGNPVFIIGRSYLELGGSEYYRIHGYLGNNPPKIRRNARDILERLIAAMDAGLILSCHDLSQGGLGVAAAEMVISSSHGLELWLERVPRYGISRNDHLLFCESNSRFLVEVDGNRVSDFRRIIAGVPNASIGRVIKQSKLEMYGLDGEIILELDSNQLRSCWKSGLNL